ncbi:MAG: type 4a pilus biogenesis protein PilO [Nitrospirales bacterium]
MDLPKVDLEFLRTVPTQQKVGVLFILVAAISVIFYTYVTTPKADRLVSLEAQVGKLNKEVQQLDLRVKHLEQLKAASVQLELELEKKKERLPPMEEATTLLKQLSDLGVRLGLDIKLWQPKKHTMDPTRLFVRVPVNVEVAGGYHTAALFFDRIDKMARIINVSNVRMGSPRVEGDRVVIQTVFEVTAFVAPPEG